MKNIKAYSEHLNEEFIIRDKQGKVLANLNASDLRFQTLNKTDLTGANLKGQSMIGATLNECKIYGADLEGANMRDCTLYSANISSTNMKNVNLHDANFWSAELNEVDLSYSTLTGAKFWYTGFRNVDFTGALFNRESVKSLFFQWDSRISREKHGMYMQGCDFTGSNFFEFFEEFKDAVADMETFFKGSKGFPDRMKKTFRSRAAFGRF